MTTKERTFFGVVRDEFKLSSAERVRILSSLAFHTAIFFMGIAVGSTTTDSLLKFTAWFLAFLYIIESGLSTMLRWKIDLYRKRLRELNERVER